MIDTMPTRVEAILGEVQEMRARGDVLLGLDFDGTLVPIAERPEQVWLDGEGRSLLEDLRDLPGVHLAIVSGRKLDDVMVRAGLDGVAYAGNHGAEIRLADRRRWSLASGKDLHVADMVRAALGRIAMGLSGVWVEDKGPVVALHYRQASTQARGALFARLASWRRAHPPGLRERPGDEVVEFFASTLPGKADALLALATASGIAGPDAVLFAGDDVTDEESFAALGPCAVTVRVGPPDRHTTARHRLLDVDEVRLFLRGLAVRREDGA